MADEIVIGKIGLTPKGDYVPGELYDILDMVSHEGNSYVSKIQNNGLDITNTEAWLLAAEKGEGGEKGDKGDTFTFEDLTPEQKEELKGDVIIYNSMTEAEKNDFASRVPITGVVEEGNTQAVSGGEVYNHTMQSAVTVSNENSDVVKDSNSLRIKTNASEYGMIKTKVHTDGSNEFVFDLNYSVFDKQFAFSTDKVSNARQHNSVKEIALSGNWRGKDIRAVQIDRMGSSPNEYRFVLTEFTSPETNVNIASGTAIWDTTSKFLRIDLSPLNSSGVSGYVIINPKIKGNYNFFNYTFGGSPKISNIVDLNKYIRDEGQKYNSIKASSNNSESIASARDLVIQTSNENYGFARTKWHRTDDSEYVFDLNDSVVDPLATLHNDFFINRRFHNVVRSISLRGNFKNYDIRLVRINSNVATKVIIFSLAHYNSSEDSLLYICEGSAVWDEISNYMNITLTSLNNSGVSGHAIIRPKMIFPYSLGVSPVVWADDRSKAPKIINIIDLNNYNESIANGVNVIARVADANAGLNRIGNILFNKKNDNSIEVIGERLQNEKVRIHTIKNANVQCDFFRDGWWYCSHGWKITRTKDFETYEDVTTFFPRGIIKTYPLNNGKIIAVLFHGTDEASLDENGIWLVETDGTKRQVLRYSSISVSSQADWNFSVRDNVCVWGEYAAINWAEGTTNSRYVYHSTDYGETWELLFDKNNHADKFSSLGKAHIHACCYDPYWKRYWITTGDDNGNKMLLWSDNVGATWSYIEMTNYAELGQNVQLLTMYATRDYVMLGPDVVPNGIFRVIKREKSDTPIIEIAHDFADLLPMTQLTKMPKKMTQLSDGMLIVPIGRGDGITAITPDEQKKFQIFATYNGITLKEIWRNEYPLNGIGNAVGKFIVTVNDNRDIVICANDTRFENGESLYVGRIENV